MLITVGIRRFYAPFCTDMTWFNSDISVDNDGAIAGVIRFILL